MQRIMTTRFAGKCSVCKAGIPAGTRAVWLGRGKGIRHEHDCAASPDNTPVPVKPAIPETTVDFTELRDAFREINNGDYSRFSKENKEVFTKHLVPDCWSSAAWSGATVEETLDRLENGYRVEGLQGMESLIPAKPRRRLKFVEEGDELLFDLAWSGIDEHFSDWEKRISKPALTIHIDMSYSARNTFERLRPYLLWLARMLQTFDEMAIDVEVKIINHSNNCDSRRIESLQSIRVKSHGEATDIAAWSAMFSPGGFRHLVFTAKVIASQKLGEVTLRGLGQPITSSEYGIEYNPDSGILHIRQAQNQDFPEFEMTQKLAALLTEIGG